jgi:hypothetical protein
MYKLYPEDQCVGVRDGRGACLSSVSSVLSSKNMKQISDAAEEVSWLPSPLNDLPDRVLHRSVARTVERFPLVQEGR